MIYKLKPILDQPGYACVGIADMSPVAKGLNFVDDFFPIDVSHHGWSVQRLGPTWRPREVVSDRPGQINDYPCIGFMVPTFSERAVECLRDLLEPNGEILPLSGGGGQYYAYNVTTVMAGILDRSKSAIKWFPGDILKKRELVHAREILHYEFLPHTVTGLSIFRLSEDVAGYYVTDRFAQRVRDHGLLGFDLRPVWPIPNRLPTGSVAIMERRAGLDNPK